MNRTRETERSEKIGKQPRKEEDAVVRRLLREARPIRWWLVLACFLCLLIIGCAMAGPKLLGRAIQQLYDYWAVKSAGGTPGGDLTGMVGRGLLVLLAVYGGHSLMSYLDMLLMNNVVSRYFTCNLRIKISDKIARMPVSYVDKTPVGEILSRMTDDVSNMGNSIHAITDTLMKGFLQIAAIAVMMFLEDWRLALIVLVMTPLSILLSVRVSSKCEKYFQRMQEESGKLYSIVEESYTNYATTKAYNLEKRNAAAHGEVNRRQAGAEARATFMQSLVQPVIAFTNALAYIVINLAGGWLILRRGVSVGTVVTIVLFAKQFASPLEEIAFGLSSMQRTKAAARRVFAILDMPEEAPVEGEIDADRVTGDVEFRNVNFSYDPETPLIRDLSMSVKAGQKVAIVGPTGAGKTTLVNLLMRFYDVDSGSILVDGVDISRVSRDSSRRLFAMVLQDTWLFGGTIADNVVYGKPDATREEIVRACDEAYCDHFIRTLPNGYDTVIGADMTNLSGGQKQLLTIARALLSNRRLLILDEATSNVDTRTELLIQKAMDKLIRGRTCFVIAHRLSTIVDADLILVLNDGRIVEQGRHQELLDRRGFYYQIYTSQYAV